MLACLVTTSGACDGYRITAGTGRFANTDGLTIGASALVGTWRHSFFFLDEFGYAKGAETTWTFNADGTASRLLVTSNFTLGVADTLATEARYLVSGTQLVIDFVAPGPGRAVFDYRVSGDQLVLAGQSYRRIGG